MPPVAQLVPRTSLTLAVRHPEVVKGVFIWEVSGGPRSGELMAPGYYGQYIEAAERGGMAAVAETEFFAQRIQDNPSNRERLLAMDVQEFCAVMRRWSAAFAAPNPVGDLTEAQLKTITCPVVLFAGNTPDEVHHVSAAENRAPPGPTRGATPLSLDARGVGCHRTARPHLPGYCRHQPLLDEGDVLRGGVARFHSQGGGVRRAHMPYVDLPGVHLWYNDTGGTGVPVVFMHAASGTCESWVYQLPVFTAAGYRCIPYDRRNWGRSRPDLDGGRA